MAKLLDKNTNTLSTILDRMEEKGLVKKNPRYHRSASGLGGHDPQGKRKIGRIHQGQPGVI